MEGLRVYRLVFGNLTAAIKQGSNVERTGKVI